MTRRTCPQGLALTMALVSAAVAGCSAPEPARVESAQGASTSGPPASAPAAQGPVSVHVTAVGEAAASACEDGRGSTGQPSAPVAIDLTARSPWAARALDPELHVGPLVLHAYTYAAPAMLRFVLCDRSVLPRQATVYVQYGPDERSRVDFSALWMVP